MNRSQRAIHDPIYGAIYPDELEWLLIHSRPMQRLKGIKQLGLVDTVYPGANHTRFEHSLGTMHMAGLIAHQLGLAPEDVRKTRLAGLFHDLGHSAFSHAVEGVLSRNSEIQPEVAGKKVSKHEEFTREIILAHPFGEKALELVTRDFGSAHYIFREVAEISLGGRTVLGQIVSGDVDADRIDFLLRDSHHSGVNLGLVDADQIIQSLSISNDRIVLAGKDDYRSEMSRTAAESMLVARAHHYNALIHHPQVQSMRSMLLVALESSLNTLEAEEARSRIILFFKEYTDPDLLRFIWENGDDRSKEMLQRIKYGREFSLAARFDDRLLPPGIRMALSTISRNGRMKKLFEDSLSRKYRAIVDISVGSGVPKSMRTESNGFLYDESALAAGLVKSLTRQIALSFFSDSPIEISLTDVEDHAFRILSFIRAEGYLPIEGLLLLFHSLHRMFSETFGERILVPRIRNITWIYRTLNRLKDQPNLAGLYDYSFHSDFGFPYSERLFEDIQILVAMGMIYQDQRHYKLDGKWLQRYEYMLTAEGLAYSETIASSYGHEAEKVLAFLEIEKHTIPYDRVSLLLKRYIGYKQKKLAGG
ncbi:MAG: HD domain-containing protein [Methanotrichaceae archaeon]|nr:HD domain-containing protein [Methanotrichaceae archaeon]